MSTEQKVATAASGVQSGDGHAAIDPAIVAQAVRARRRGVALRWILGIAVPIALLALWQLANAIGLIDRRFIPPPTQVFSQMWDGVFYGSLATDLADHGWASLQRLVPGFVIGIVVGLVVGIAMGLFDTVRYGLSPVISSTFPIPKIAIFPLVIVIFGIGDISKVVVIAIGVFFMVAINTVSGIIYSDRVYRDVATAFRIPKRVEYLRIVIPAALPEIMTGVRLGFGNALIIVVSTEFVAADQGVGFYIWNAWQVLDIEAMFGGLIVIGAVGIIGNWLLILLERKMIPWSRV